MASISELYDRINQYNKKIESLKDDIKKLEKMRTDTDKTKLIVDDGEVFFNYSANNLRHSFHGERALYHYANYGVIADQIKSLQENLIAVATGIGEAIKELESQIRDYENLIADCKERIRLLEEEEDAYVPTPPKVTTAKTTSSSVNGKKTIKTVSNKNIITISGKNVKETPKKPGGKNTALRD